MAVSLIFTLQVVGIALGLSETATSASSPSPYAAEALKYLGARCNSLTAVGCNPFQLPVYTDQAFVPELLILTPDASDIYIDPGQITDDDTHVELSTSGSSVAKSISSTYGISGTVPYDGISFTGGVKYQHMAQELNTYKTENYYSEIQRKFIVAQASLTPETVQYTLSPQFVEAFERLPDTANNTTDKAKWFDFFSKYGTHYLKTVALGGVMRVRTFLSSSIRNSSIGQSSDWDWYLAAKFNESFNMGIAFDSEHTQSKYDEFWGASYQSDTFAFAAGGDESLRDYWKWKASVPDRPTHIITTLGPMKELFPGGEIPLNKSWDAALKAYYDACPHTENLGMCNGYGLCDAATASCTCSSVGTYAEKDGNCYPQCPTGSKLGAPDTNKDGADVCSGQGECSYGRCKCRVTGDGLGFKGMVCQEKCGTHDFVAGGDNAWCVPGTDCDFMQHSLESGSCWCRSTTGLDDDDMKATDETQSGPVDPPAYSACGDRETCSYSVFPPVIYCNVVTSITCQYGDGSTCASGSASIPWEPDSVPARASKLPNRTYLQDPLVI